HGSLNAVDEERYVHVLGVDDDLDLVLAAQLVGTDRQPEHLRAEHVALRPQLEEGRRDLDPPVHGAYSPTIWMRTVRSRARTWSKSTNQKRPNSPSAMAPSMTGTLSERPSITDLR